MSVTEPQVPEHLSRLDETTWELHDEPPSAADASRDRAAIRCITTYWVLAVGLYAWVVGAILPSFFDLVPTFDSAVLVGGFVVLCAAASAVQRLGWRVLRSKTGYPVPPSLYLRMWAVSALMAYFKALFNVSAEDLEPQNQPTSETQGRDSGSSDSAVEATEAGRPETEFKPMTRGERAEFKRTQRKKRRALQQTTTRIVLRVEQAAAAERWGWTWWSHRCSVKIAELVQPYTALYERLNPDDTDTAQEESATSDS